MDTSKSPEGGSESEETPGSDPTMAYTDEQSHWRAATVISDEDTPLGVVHELQGVAVAETGGRYQIREVIGTGGMGEVRLCRDDAVGRDVALKTLHHGRATDARAQRRFLRE